MANILIAVNRQHSGKCPVKIPDDATPEEKDRLSRDQLDWFRAYNGQFENVRLTVEQLADEIRAGHGITTQHKEYRKKANYLRGQHLGLDFDTGDERSSIETLLRDPFIAEHAAILYATPSHTDEAPRSRVLFILDRPVAIAEKYSLASEALTNHYAEVASADRSTKDPCRLFFGAGEGGRVVVREGKILPLETLAEKIVNPYRERLEAERQAEIERLQSVQTVGPDSDDPRLQRRLDAMMEKMLDTVITAPDGEKHDTRLRVARAVGGYVAAGYFNHSDARNALRAAAAQNTNNLRLAYQTIDDGLEYGLSAPLYLEDTPTERGIVPSQAIPGKLLTPDEAEHEEQFRRRVFNQGFLAGWQSALRATPDRVRLFEHYAKLDLDMAVQLMGLGYREDLVIDENDLREDDGKPKEYAALVVPFRVPGEDGPVLENVAYDILMPPSDEQSRLWQHDEGATLFVPKPDEPLSGPMVLVDEPAAATELWVRLLGEMEMAVAGLPQVAAEGRLREVLKDCEPIYLMWPELWGYPTTDENGKKIESRANHIARVLGAERVRWLEIPGKPGDMLWRYQLKPHQLARFVRMSRPITA